MELRPPQSFPAILPHSGVSHCLQTQSGPFRRQPSPPDAVWPHSDTSHCLQTQSGYFFGLKESFRDTLRLNTRVSGRLSALSTQK